MGQIRDTGRMFSGVTYNVFTTYEVGAAMRQKVAEVCAKIESRRKRVERIITEHKIKPERVADLVLQYMRDQESRKEVKTYSSTMVSASGPADPEDRVVPAGVVANLVTEKDLIANESQEVVKMSRILNNLRDRLPRVDAAGNIQMEAVVHRLSEDDIDYLGMKVSIDALLGEEEKA